MLRITVLFYLSWMLLTTVVHYLPVPENIGAAYPYLLFNITVAFYLLLVLYFVRSIIFAVFALTSQAVWRYFILVAVIFAITVVYARFTGPLGFFVGGIASANLLFVATLLGTLLSTAIKRMGELVPVSLTAAVADGFSVTMGPTKKFIAEITAYYQQGLEGTPPWVDFILVKAVVPGANVAVPLFGVTDWVFLVLLSSALLRLGKTDNILFPGSKVAGYFFVPVTGVSLYLGLIAAQLTGKFIPAMVLMTVFFLVFLVLRFGVHRQMRRSDLYYSCIFPGVVAFILWLYSGKASFQGMFI